MDYREGNPTCSHIARKIVEGVNKQPSFASVVAKQVVSVGCQTDAVEIRSATDATNVSATPGSSSAKPNTSKETVNKRPVAEKNHTMELSRFKVKLQ